MGAYINERKHATLLFGLREMNVEAMTGTSRSDPFEARRRVNI